MEHAVESTLLPQAATATSAPRGLKRIGPLRIEEYIAQHLGHRLLRRTCRHNSAAVPVVMNTVSRSTSPVDSPIETPLWSGCRVIRGNRSFSSMLICCCGRWLTFLAPIAALAAAPPVARANVGEVPEQESHWQIHLDNDGLSGARSDQDYSWGVSVIGNGREATAGPLVLLDQWLERSAVQSRTAEYHEPAARAWSAGLLGFTPSTLKSRQPVPDDRPFASLLYATRSSLVLSDSGLAARFSSVTVGWLGTGLAPSVQARVHKWVADEQPLGWDHQISEGGEPTLRYVWAQHRLVQSVSTSSVTRLDSKLSFSASAGFLSEATAALSMRWGRPADSWWSDAPELTDYAPAPLASNAAFDPTSRAWHFFAGTRVKARAYNALLQGQFRHSAVTVDSANVEPLLLEGWFGFSRQWGHATFRYVARASTSEIRRGPGRRALVWGCITVERQF